MTTYVAILRAICDAWTAKALLLYCCTQWPRIGASKLALTGEASFALQSLVKASFDAPDVPDHWQLLHPA